MGRMKARVGGGEGGESVTSLKNLCAGANSPRELYIVCRNAGISGYSCLRFSLSGLNEVSLVPHFLFRCGASEFRQNSSIILANLR